ncbi:MAG TPA: RidA family protein [Polyangiaceae bacterium]|nr:RidA family protein [Polyangiaceae bacterium]
MRANVPIALCIATGCASSSPPSLAPQSASARRAITIAGQTGLRSTDVVAQYSPTSPVGQRVNPAQLPKPNGYSHVVAVGAGRTLYISGQVGIDRDGKVVGAGDFRAQAEQVFANLNEALKAVDANFGNVVKLTFFVTELTPENLTILREVRDRHIDPAHAPASSLVEVARLFRRELVVEVEAVAVVPD